MIGEIYKNLTPVSGYQPSKDVADFTNVVKKEYTIGSEILHRPWTELNDRNIIDDENRGQMMFNAFVDTSFEDPNDAWKYRGTRSSARNKGITMHANLTQNFLLPLYTAQNENDEIDRDFSEVMRDLVEWMAMPNNSNYQSSFLQVTTGMLTNPVTYLGAEFYECYQKIKEKQEDGSIVTKEVLDEVYSGYQAPIYSSSEILITNAFQRNIQKQRSLIQRRYIELEEAKAKYGEHENWQYVTVGIKSIFNSEDGLFYDVKDTTSAYRFLIAEETYKGRRDDTEVCFLNGIYFGEENVDDNPIRHRDNFGAPKYNITPFGYSRIGDHFFYYKSMMNVLGWDNAFYDAMTETVMNRAFLEVDQPIVTSGGEKIDSDVIFPKAVISSESDKFKAVPLLPPSNLQAGFQALSSTAASMSDETVSPILAGSTAGLSVKTPAAVLSSILGQAKILLGEVSQILGQSIIQYGDLMKDIALNHITAPQVEEILGGNLKLKYKTFFLENKQKGGRAIKKQVKFDPSLIGMDMTDDEKDTANLKLLEDSGYPDEHDSIRLVNPELFAKFKFLSRVDLEEMYKKNQEYWQPILLNLKQALAQDPTINQEELTRKLMYSYFLSEGDELVKKTPPMPPQGPQIGQDGTAAGKMGNPASSSPFGAMVQNGQLASRAANVVR